MTATPPSATPSTLRGPALWTIAGALAGSGLTGAAWVATARLDAPPPEPPGSVWVEPTTTTAAVPAADPAPPEPEPEPSEADEPVEESRPVRTGIAISTRRIGPEIPDEPGPITRPDTDPPQADDEPPASEPDRDPQPTAVVRIRVNTASAAELELLPGIGPKLAARIIAERNANGPFRSVDDLQRVRGIGPKTAANLAPHVRFD